MSSLAGQPRGALETLPGPALADHWRASRQAGGPPGTNDTLRLDDSPTLLDYALAAPPTAVLDAGEPVFTWGERLGADEVTIAPELSPDLLLWQPQRGARFIESQPEIPKALEARQERATPVR